MIVPVILSGGSGTRLWPLSRDAYPKQFLPLADARTMLQATASRVRGLAAVTPPLVVCNEEHRFMVAEQLREIGVQPTAVILEPVGRNTAPAVAVAALHVLAGGDDPLLLVLPADHVIADVAGFRAAVERAAAAAAAGFLITFGIVPTAAETGYGYIKAGAAAGEGVSRVERFVEKPDVATASAYVASGSYLWNSGMFLFRASRYLEELQRFNPAIVEACRAALASARADVDFLRLERAAFTACPSDSIDYAVMERTQTAAVTPLAVGWNDVGAWSALWDVGSRDEAGNVFCGDVYALDTRNTYVRADRLVATVGLDDAVIVETPDAVLVARRDRVQDVKKIVERLKAEGRGEWHHHRKVYRPWGAYDSIDNADRFQVKRISVKPGGALSLQMHHHRAEHWIVVKGTARITRGDETFLLTENQSTYIPLGITHRLENPGKIPLELIEVQSGAYLGEDDIVRFDDVYGRQDGQ
ncbi:mannose-1-phosphate guanylyltransferase/mannose-6-phosphate isomerase [Plasticicumulans lactativorans]|uniref:mannose-1-phosphate guanylyltransferase n=1 Tax=Plasticicumulans lactativorans TaxID=1133106 RepID=A0A4R2L9P5_9GAMM|nr:mannose-1-phosphate guanylyltransferase/mannose-6-phosphate isomerase [Plasticicumulans lactativorans]TCO80989.1 mannose-1-phosphate guanylyltransferase/mannose-6-phosphate isomerase [Plasticicumulans lactativorans]